MPPPRLRPLLFCSALFLLGNALLRGLLSWTFRPVSPVSGLLQVFAYGAVLDLAVTAVLLFPLFLWLVLLPERLFRHAAHRFAMKAFLIFWSAGQVFLFVCEYYFFAEFDSRFNHIALDYLIFPHEVFVNIWESYPAGRAAFGAVVAGAMLFQAGGLVFGDPWERPIFWKQRRRSAAGFLAAGFAAVLLAALVKPGAITEDRVLGQLAGNGFYGLVHAAYTHHLDFPAYYRTLSREEAFARSRRTLSQEGVRFDERADSIQRFVSGEARESPLNVVLVLIESFGSEFSAVFGGAEPSYTPHFDAWSKKGLAFRRMYASGNRTVRGLEGVLASFAPLPGDSIVKRDRSEHVSTLARVLKEQGYDTLFFYGGRGVFDGMRSFALDNGYDRFIEQKDFKAPQFTTIWGVADEELFDRSLEELRALSSKGKPFLATILTVSNHKPYTYPKGRIDLDPDARSRQHAVKYTDWALGRFLAQAKKERFYKDTVFVVLADHGARVYGKQSIPIRSYEIPMIVLSPTRRKPAVIDALGCSLDVAPTILGLLGRPYRSVFFGADLLKLPPKGGRVLTHHNRDIGMLRDGGLVVLGLNKTLEFYRLDPATRELELKRAPDKADLELSRDAMALFQVADELYTQRRYRVE
jgi:phosphoglycerol transferase MdoB-like AlkP superfamily enzyme